MFSLVIQQRICFCCNKNLWWQTPIWLQLQRFTQLVYLGKRCGALLNFELSTDMAMIRSRSGFLGLWKSALKVWVTGFICYCQQKQPWPGLYERRLGVWCYFYCSSTAELKYQDIWDNPAFQFRIISSVQMSSLKVSPQTGSKMAQPSALILRYLGSHLTATTSNLTSRFSASLSPSRQELLGCRSRCWWNSRSRYSCRSLWRW